MAKQFQLGETAAKQLADVVRFAGRQPRNPRARRRRGPVGAAPSGTQFRKIRFSLPSALTSSMPYVDSCTVLQVRYGSDPGSTVTCWNEDGWESDAGSEGDAEYNPVDGKWYIKLLPCATGAS